MRQEGNYGKDNKKPLGKLQQDINSDHTSWQKVRSEQNSQCRMQEEAKRGEGKKKDKQKLQAQEKNTSEEHKKTMNEHLKQKPSPQKSPDGFAQSSAFI